MLAVLLCLASRLRMNGTVPLIPSYDIVGWTGTAYAVIHGLVLLIMGIMMPETSRERSLIINVRLVASFWFISLHPM